MTKYKKKFTQHLRYIPSLLRPSNSTPNLNSTSAYFWHIKKIKHQWHVWLQKTCYIIHLSILRWLYVTFSVCFKALWKESHFRIYF